MSLCRVLADLVVVFHAVYVGFVVFGLVLVLVGWARGWAWVRNVWFRAVHLALIAVVAGEALLGIVCPLTTLENSLRRKAGQVGYPGDFIGYWAHQLIFAGWQDLPPWVLTGLYVAFTLLVGLMFLLAPPRLKRRGT